MKLNRSKIILIGSITFLFFVFFYFDLARYMSLEYVRSNKDLLNSFYESRPLLTFFGYFAIYVAAAALAFPGVVILTLFSGFLFGVFKGTLLVSFASTIGATCSFLITRFLFKEALSKKFGRRLKKINSHLESEGGFYLFSLRLVPAVPFFLLNILMGLSPMKTKNFYIISQIGMLPMTIVYVNAGDQISRIGNLRDIVSIESILSLILVVFFSFFIKKIWPRVSSKVKKIIFKKH